MNPKPYTDSDRSNRLWWYLLLITLLSAFCFITLDVWLLPCSIAYHETGTMTAGYLLYAAIGLLFSTPTPFIAVIAKPDELKTAFFAKAPAKASAADMAFRPAAPTFVEPIVFMRVFPPARAIASLTSG